MKSPTKTQTTNSANATLQGKTSDTQKAQTEVANMRLSEVQAQLQECNRDLAREHHLRFEETAALTHMLESYRKEQKLHDDVVAKLEGVVANLKSENARLTAKNAGFLSSTSWRITAPIRLVKLALTRHK